MVEAIILIVVLAVTVGILWLAKLPSGTAL